MLKMRDTLNQTGTPVLTTKQSRLLLSSLRVRVRDLFPLFYPTKHPFGRLESSLATQTCKSLGILSELARLERPRSMAFLAMPSRQRAESTTRQQRRFSREQDSIRDKIQKDGVCSDFGTFTGCLEQLNGLGLCIGTLENLSIKSYSNFQLPHKDISSAQTFQLNLCCKRKFLLVDSHKSRSQMHDNKQLTLKLLAFMQQLAVQ